ncbi:Hypothetical predicted protein [Pelobates cultripes]|uniref:Uncharacterized protein n=1 Tax=Pelobates cultripes TaxID=61616 RepID=A0AAD1W5B8_PELCU|nr:Hypothetical predicted protein [Pelobates cultripes]
MTKYQWKLNPHLLPNTPTRKAIETCNHQYFDTNKTPDTSSTIQWEAHKCVIRGELIKWGSHLKREKSKTRKKLYQDIKTLEESHKTSLSESDFAKLMSLRSELKILPNDTTKKAMLWSKQRYYTHRDRCGRLLASALKEQQQRTYIPKMRRADGTLAHTAEDIA